MGLVRVSTASGRVTVVAEARAQVVVDEGGQVSTDGDTTTVSGTSERVALRVPVGTDLVIGTESGRVMVDGDVGAVAVTTSSGRIQIESAATVDARTNSGRVEIGRASGAVRVKVVSSRVAVGAAGDVYVANGSGRVALRGVDGRVEAHAESGRVEIEMVAAHDVEVETVSGRIDVALPPGTRVHRRWGREDETPAPPGTDCTVMTSTVSGRVQVSP